MKMGHIPLTFLVTGSASFIYAIAFGLGTAAPTASIIILIILLALSALVRRPKIPAPITDEVPAFARALTTGTRFTLVRVAITCLLGGLAILPTDSDQPTAVLWSLVIFGIGAALLEASDNWLARVTGSRSLYSDRLSNMTGAFFALTLALLPIQLGVIDSWVIVAGLLGFAEVALSHYSAKGETPLSQIWSRLLARSLMLAVLVPLNPDWGGPVLAGLASLILFYQVILAINARQKSAKPQN